MNSRFHSEFKLLDHNAQSLALANHIGQFESFNQSGGAAVFACFEYLHKTTLDRDNLDNR